MRTWTHSHMVFSWIKMIIFSPDEKQSLRFTGHFLEKHFLLFIFNCLPPLVLDKVNPIRHDILMQITANTRSQAVNILEAVDASSSGDKKDACQKEESFQKLLMNLQTYPKMVCPGISLVWKLLIQHGFIICACSAQNTLFLIYYDWTNKVSSNGVHQSCNVQFVPAPQPTPSIIPQILPTKSSTSSAENEAFLGFNSEFSFFSHITCLLFVKLCLAVPPVLFKVLLRAGLPLGSRCGRSSLVPLQLHLAALQAGWHASC